jgi:hypothetical protein
MDNGMGLPTLECESQRSALRMLSVRRLTSRRSRRFSVNNATNTTTPKIKELHSPAACPNAQASDASIKETTSSAVRSFHHSVEPNFIVTPP